MGKVAENIDGIGIKRFPPGWEKRGNRSRPARQHQSCAISPARAPWLARRADSSENHPPLARGTKTTDGSTSIRNDSSARLVTPIQVEHGGLSPNTALRARLIALPSCMWLCLM